MQRLEDSFLKTKPSHERWENQGIGVPAVIPLGDSYPSIHVVPYGKGVLSGIIRFGDEEIIAEIEERVVETEQDFVLSLKGSPTKAGTYEVCLKFSSENASDRYSSIYFLADGPGLEPVEGCSLLRRDVAGKLVYVPDYRGNRLPDFSNAGYEGGGVQIPQLPVKAVVEPVSGDATETIQRAIDQVSSLPLDDNGFRGAVLLKKGTYEILSNLSIRTGGVVLRGEGSGEDGTILFAAGETRRNLIVIEGPEGITPLMDTESPITDSYVPVGSRDLHVANGERFQVGDAVVVRAFTNDDFIREIGMDRISPRPENPGSTRQWKPFELNFDRIVIRVEGDRITLDAPLVHAIDSKYGGGSIWKIEDHRIENSGIEQISGVSYYNPDITEHHEDGALYCSDENHASGFAALDNIKNAWVRDFRTVHFSHDGVKVGRMTKWVTVEDGETLDMVSVITGGRRSPYNAIGQLTLFQRLRADTTRHAFVVQSQVCGPVVFLFGEATTNFNTSEPHQRWSVGGLFDNIKAPISIQDRQYYGSGHGWSGANYVAWNTEGDLVLQKTPTANNWAIGHIGTQKKGAFEPREQGHWESLGLHVKPSSLYLQQLKDRLGADAVHRIGYSDFE